MSFYSDSQFTQQFESYVNEMDQSVLHLGDSKVKIESLNMLYGCTCLLVVYQYNDIICNFVINLMKQNQLDCSAALIKAGI